QLADRQLRRVADVGGPYATGWERSLEWKRGEIVPLRSGRHPGREPPLPPQIDLGALAGRDVIVRYDQALVVPHDPGAGTGAVAVDHDDALTNAAGKGGQRIRELARAGDFF